jgi:hypothetical protein
MLTENSLKNGKKSELNWDNNLEENLASFNIKSKSEVENDKKEKPPTFLLVLCILTFVNTGITILSGILGIIAGPPSAEEVKESNVQMAETISQLEKVNLDYWVDVIQRIQLMTESMYANFVAYNSVSVFVAIVGVAAAIMMFKGKKLGFHVYIGYSFLYVLQGYIFVSAAIIPSFIIIINLLIAGLFVLLYSRNLSWLNK